MATPHTSPPRHDTPVPAASSDIVVPLRPKPPALPALSPVARPVIIEQDVVDYLVKLPLEQRWRVLSRVAMATYDEPAPASVPPAPPSQKQPMVVVPAPTPRAVEAPPPPSQRPQLELVDQTREAAREERAAASTAPPPPPSASRIAATATARASAPPRASVPAPATRASVAAPPPRISVPTPPSSSPRPVSSAPPPSVPRPASAAPPRHSAPPPLPAEKAAGGQAEELFEVMHELTLCGDAPSGARFCLGVALAAVPALAGLVHLRDPRTLELVVVHAHGPRADGQLRMRTQQSDALVERATHARKPIVATYGAEPDAEKTVCPRHAFFDPWSVLVVPVIHGGQLLGLLEIIDPIDGSPFDPQAQSSLAYVADRLAQFLAEHPVG